MNTFHFGYSTHAHNKEIKGDISLGWLSKVGTVDDLASHVNLGLPVCHSVFKCEKRLDTNFAFAEIILVDIDNSAILKDEHGKPVKGNDGKAIKVYKEELTIPQALEHPFIKKYCFYIYTSASHKPDHHKYRLAFWLPNRITDPKLFKAVLLELRTLIPAIDRAATSITNIYFGNDKAIDIIVNPDASPIPQEFIDKAIASREALEAEKQALKANREAWKPNYADCDNDRLEREIYRALEYISPRIEGGGTYDTSIRVCWALAHHFGEAKAIAIMESHSPSHGKWDVAKVVSQAHKYPDVTLGSLFHFAKCNGYKREELTAEEKKAWFNGLTDGQKSAWLEKKGLKTYSTPIADVAKKLTKEDKKAFRVKKIEAKVTESKLDFYALRKPDLCLNQRYLSTFDVPKNRFWVGVNSYKGTGKNYLQMELAKKIYKELGLPILYITQLTNLVNLAAEAPSPNNPTGLGLVSIYELMAAKDDRREELLLEIRKNGLACTLDSFHKIKILLPDFVPFVTFFDEAESGCECVLDSSTAIAKHRTETINCKRELMQASKQKYPNSHAYCFDSDLTDISMDWYTSLTGDRVADAFIVRNDFKVAKGRIAYFYKDRKAWLNGYVDTSDRTICYANSQQVNSKFSGKNLDELTGNSLIIDSDTTKNPEEKAYRSLSDNTYLALMRQHKRTVHTSSMGIGVSITEDGLFDSKWCISFGSQGVGKLLQGVDRYRNNIPLHIWVQPTGLGIVGRGAVDWREVYADLITSNNETLKSLLISDIYDESGLKKSAETYAKLIARRNYELLNYAENVRKKLVEDGYDVQFFGGNDDATLSKELKEIKDTKVESYCDAVTNADISNEFEIEAIKRKQELTDNERIKLTKANLESRYLIEINPSLVRNDLDGNYSRLRLQYFLTDGFEYLPQRDKDRLQSLLGDDNLLFAPDVNKSLLAGKIALLKMIDPMSFIDGMGSDEVKDNDDRVIDFHTHLKTFEPQLARYFGIKLDGKKAMTDIRKILRVIAYDFVSDSKSKKRTKPRTIQQIYKDRNEIFKSWLKHDAETTILRAKFPNNNIVIENNYLTPKEIASGYF